MPKGYGELNKLITLFINKNKIKKLFSEMHNLKNLKNFGLDWFIYAYPPLPCVYLENDYLDENYT